MIVQTDMDRLLEIERHLSEATPGTHERDCGGRIFSKINGEELQIGEAYAAGDARLWRHAGEDIVWLLQEVRRLNEALSKNQTSKRHD